MRALQEHDFDQMAERVVDRFMGGEKLADAATAEAMGGQLGPDQIERMVQSANTMAFLRLMEQQKTQAGAASANGAPPNAGPDMTHEFDPIDARQVIQQIMSQVDVPYMDGPPQPGMPPEMPPDDLAPLPNEMGGGGEAMPARGHAPPRDGDADGKVDFDGDHDDDDNDGPFPKGSKDKKPKKDKKPPAEAKKDEAKEAAFRARRQRKLADILADQYKQAEWTFEDTFTKLETVLKQAWGGPTWDAFEKDAMAQHGDEYGATVLNLVRQARRLPPISADEVHAKHAALADRHIVDDDNEAAQIFGTLVKIATVAAALQRGVEYLRAQCA